MLNRGYGLRQQQNTGGTHQFRVYYQSQYFLWHQNVMPSCTSTVFTSADNEVTLDKVSEIFRNKFKEGTV